MARSALHLPREGALAVYCGHFYDEKGVPSLVDAAQLLPKATVQLVGGWPEDIERMRERTIRQCGLDHVHLAREADDARLRISADEIEIGAHDGCKLRRGAGDCDARAIQEAPLRPFHCVRRNVFEPQPRREIRAR